MEMQARRPIFRSRRGHRGGAASGAPGGGYLRRKNTDMHHLRTIAIVTLIALWPASNASAQLLLAKDAPIVYGHHHLNATSVAPTKKFFAEKLGGARMVVGENKADVVKFQNVFVYIRPMTIPKGGSKGTTVDHIGFSVTNLREVLDKVKAAGYRIVTREEAAPTVTVKDDIVAVANGPLSGA